MRVILAPMEGVMDPAMRDVVTALGGFDLVVTEFVRVVDQLLPRKVFRRLVPELDNGGRSIDGTPVRVQLLGQYPEWLAENAVRAVELGSHGLDLNFGCPSKTVNKSKGGAVLLREPDKVYAAVKGVRDALPAHVTVSAKMRLGFDDKSLALENARAICEAGASEMTVHARTKVEGYKPPAHWHWIAKIKDVVDIPVIANGDIWNREDYLACQAASTCDDVMLGRGTLSLPNLARVIKQQQEPLTWPEMVEILNRYAAREVELEHRARWLCKRIKQWLRYLERQFPEATSLFDQVKVITEQDVMLEALGSIELS